MGQFISSMSTVTRSIVLFAAVLLPLAAWADVTIRPNERPKETTKDFIKDQKKNGFVSPEPVNGSAQFIAGQSVVVELKVTTASLGYVKFVIREQPKHGTLSDIRPHPSAESNRALVTYTHNGDHEELNDRFTFAARAGESSTSAAGVITLTGRKAVANVQVLDPPKFKSLQPGEQSTTTFVLKNIGNAPFTGDLDLPAPFSGPRHVDLAVNEKLSVMIMVKPEAPGTYRIDQELQPGQPASRLQAMVECAQAFVVTPGAITLAFDPVTGQRKASVKVANGSNAPLKLRVDCSNRLQVVKEISLDTKGTSEVSIALAKGDVAAFRGELSIVQEPSRQKVMISADPAPAHILLAAPKDGKVDFGQIIKGKVAEAKISILNDGGVAAVLQAAQVPPFLIHTDLSSLKAEPGKTVEIVISFNPDLPGSYNQSLFIAGNAGRLELTMKGTMIDPARPNGSTPGAGGANAPVRPRDTDAVPPRPSVSRPSASVPSVPVPSVAVPSIQPAPVMALRPPPAAVAPEPVVKAVPAPAASAVATGESAKGARAVASFKQMAPAEVAMYANLMTYGISPTTTPAFQSHSIDPIPNIGVLERGKDNLVLLWEAPKVEPAHYLIESSYLVRNGATGLMLKAWKPFTEWQPAKSPQQGLTAARLTGLKPDTQYELRVLGIDKEGKFSAPSGIVQVVTASPFHLPGWTWQFLIAVVFLAIVYTGYQLKQGDWQV